MAIMYRTINFNVRERDVNLNDFIIAMYSSDNSLLDFDAILLENSEKSLLSDNVDNILLTSMLLPEFKRYKSLLYISIVSVCSGDLISRHTFFIQQQCKHRQTNQ